MTKGRSVPSSSKAPTEGYHLVNKDHLDAYTLDRLTSTNSTLILSDDTSDQTLTGNLGGLIIAPTSAWMALTGTFFPTAAGTYDLGSTTYEWDKAYISSSIFLGSAQEVQLSESSGDLIVAPTGDTQFNTNITFDAVTNTIAGIQNQNLLDKSATETVSGDWTFSGTVTLDGYLPDIGSSTDNALVRWDGATGQAVQDSNWIVDDLGTLLCINNGAALGLFTAGSAEGVLLYHSGGNPQFRFAGADLEVGIYFGADSFKINSSTGVVTFHQNVAFNGSETIAGITNTDLVDKSATETIAGTWTFTPETVFTNGLDVSTSGRFDSNVADAASAASFRFKPTVALTSGTDRSYFLVENPSGTDLFEVQSDGNIYLKSGGIYTGGVTKGVIATDKSYVGGAWNGALTSAVYRGLRAALTVQPDTGTSANRNFYGGAFNLSFNDGNSYTGQVASICGGFFECYASRDDNTVLGVYGGDFNAYAVTTLTNGCAYSIMAAGRFRNYFTGTKRTITTAASVYCEWPTGLGTDTTITNHGTIFIPDQKDLGTNFQTIWIKAQTANAAGTHNNIYMQGGDFDDGHIQLNTQHIWSDGSTLRGKASAPTASGEGRDLLAESVFFAYNQTGGITLPASWTDITWLTEIKKDGDYTHAASSAEVEIDTAGWYEITAEGAADVSDTTRSHSDWRLVLNVGLGYNEITGTRAYAYHRTSADGKDSVTIHWILNAGANNKIKLQGQSNRATQVTTVANACRIYVKRLS